MYISAGRNADVDAVDVAEELDPATGLPRATHPHDPGGPAGVAGPAGSGVPGGRRRWLRRGVHANVVALGTVSLVTDVSSEMVNAVLPNYLVNVLHVSVLAFGVLDGLYSGLPAFVRLVGAHLADRWQRRKAVAGFGYALSAVCKLGLLAAGRSVPAIGSVLATDRTGKGLRTAPRDALISLSSRPEDLGRSFGVHRAMDTVGAFFGPLVAFGVLSVAVGAYDALFVVSFCIAAFAVLLLVAFVRDRRSMLADRRSVSVRAGLALLGLAPFRRLCVCTVLLGLVTVSDAFIYLLLRDRLEIADQYFPLLPLGTAGSYLLLAVFTGILADRIGRWTVFLAGHVALLAAYGLLLSSLRGLPLLAGVLALHGTFYAATDGVLMAFAGPMLPAALQTSGLALVQTGQVVARSGASVLFGVAWTMWDRYGALAAAAVALAVALPVCALLIPPGSRPRGPDQPAVPAAGRTAEAGA